jgi:hypothetical protein
MSFLHEEKASPVDEFPRVTAPACEVCEAEMWMMRVEKTVSDDGVEGIYKFECPRCRAKMEIRRRTSKPTRMPLTPAVTDATS